MEGQISDSKQGGIILLMMVLDNACIVVLTICIARFCIGDSPVFDWEFDSKTNCYYSLSNTLRVIWNTLPFGIEAVVDVLLNVLLLFDKYTGWGHP